MSKIKPVLLLKPFRSIIHISYVSLFLLVSCSLSFIQCKKELTTTSSSATLAFSTNLLFFDTVFVTQGSSTQVFVVHNNNSEAVVTSINLRGSYTSPFKINVDGVSGISFSNIKIPAKDSIYIFAQVNVNPLNTNNPSLIKDSLVFITNGNTQWVDLQAYGWNAYYYHPDIFPASGPAFSVIDASDSVWKNDKPHVVFGQLVVLPRYTLHIEAGTQVFMHDSAILLVDSGAGLNVSGTYINQVVFQGDRIEPDYKYIPGQWGEILMYKSLPSKISWAVIQNAITGIQVDTLTPRGFQPGLSIDHTIIKSMAYYGMVAEGTSVSANNCLLADCGNSCLAILYGGTYSFNQCTMADYWGVDNTNGSRTTSLLQMNNYYLYGSQTIYRPIYKAFFGNCIIYGALNDEIKFDSAASPQDSMSYDFENCLLRTTLTTFLPKRMQNNIINQDPLFSNPAGDNYQLSNNGSGSPAEGTGNASILFPGDSSLDGYLWNSPPNIGAYHQ